MNKALYSGLSSTYAHQVKMDVAANNLANVSTVGYKSSRVSFQDAFYQTLRSSRPSMGGQGSTSALQVGSGVTVGGINTVNSQGTLEYSGQALDAAIDGSGMFILSGADGQVYTREGIFRLDGTNNLTMASTGLRVQGWSAVNDVIDTNGPIGDLSFALRTMRSPKATDSVTLEGNLDSAAAVGEIYNSSVTVYDSLGDAHELSIVYTKTATNTWGVSATCEGTTATGALTFDPTGALTAGGALALTAVMPNGSANLVLNIDTTMSTQYAGRNDIAPTEQSGYPAATLLGVSIADAGLVIGTYSDGRSASLGQLALATFPNVDGLERAGNNLYSTSAASGLAQTGAPGSAGLGDISGQAVEMSNTDMTSAFLEMLVTQRAYQASTRVISTANELIEEAIRMTQ